MTFRVRLQDEVEMTRVEDTNRSGDGGTAYSRRTVLRTGGALVGAAATGGVAAAQNETGDGGATTETRVTTTAVTPEQEGVEGDLTGMWIHVGPQADPIQTSIADACDIVDWGDEDTIAYDVQLIDRRADPVERSIELYLPRRVEVGSGDLFIINDMVPCESGYVGLELEQIGARDIDAGVDAGGGLTETEFTEQGGGPLGQVGPGFGWLAGAAGLLGGGWLLSQRDGEE